MASNLTTAVPMTRAGRWLPAGLIAAALIWPGPWDTALAQTDDQQWAYCASENGEFSFDLEIGGCTALIQSGRLTTENLAIAFTNRGAAYYRQSDYVRAFADYDQAIALNPQNAGAYRSRGLARQGLRDYDGALADAARASQLDPNAWGPPSDMGDIHLARANYHSAIVEYTLSIELDQSQAWNFAHRAQAYEALNDLSLAFADYVHAARLKPDDTASQAGICRVSKANEDRQKLGVRSWPWYVNNEPVTIYGRTYIKYGLPRILDRGEVEIFQISQDGVFYAETASDERNTIYLQIDDCSYEFQPYAMNE